VSKRERFFYLALCAYGFGTIAAIGAWLIGQHVIAIVLLFAVACFAVAANDATFAVIPWLKGENAENAVRAELEELRSHGYIVVNDVMFGGEGNIDHFVSGPNGAFMIETKFARYTPDQLGRARRQARRIHDEIGCWVTPVICAGTRKKTYSHQGVVITGRGIVAETIRAQPPHRQPDPARLRRFVDRRSR
jgi:hypothetical protein